MGNAQRKAIEGLDDVKFMQRQHPGFTYRLEEWVKKYDFKAKLSEYEDIVRVEKELGEKRKGKLAGNQLAQAAEIVALTEACKLFKGQDVTIYTDSQYAYATTHTFAKLWSRRGMETSTGKPVQHAALLTELLSAVMLPRTLAICKCKAHTNGTDLISQGNAKADAAAKAAAGNTISQTYVVNDSPKDIIPRDVLKDMQDNAPPSEISRWLLEGAHLKDNELYRVAGKLCLPRALFPVVAKLSHGRSHVSTRGMVSMVGETFHITHGLITYFKTFCRSCLTCCRHNTQGNARPKRGKTPQGTYPFEIRPPHHTAITINATNTELSALRLMTMQNRMALDLSLAGQGGVCTIVGEACCTFIPDNSGEGGIITRELTKLIKLRDEVQNSMTHADFDWWSWLSTGSWVSVLFKAFVPVLVVLVLLCLLCGCLVPCVRAMIQKAVVGVVRVQYQQLSQQDGNTPDLYPIPDYEPDDDSYV
ncbi:uncharacterized protein LOC117949044 [Etheostoma cragini]|uniref:uncharacterized protein LOC117949044 n=1 Tax=Etheostoma cragini TaxID=417921 RepID=UPI00155DE2DA|nr:uncharacterized protein LOC117949044 [Etheostoma cragini]